MVPNLVSPSVLFRGTMSYFNFLVARDVFPFQIFSSVLRNVRVSLGSITTKGIPLGWG